MYKSLCGQAPQYLAADVQLLADSGRRFLRSANYRTCVVSQTQNSFGYRVGVCGYTRTRGFTCTRPVPAGRVGSGKSSAGMGRVAYSHMLTDFGTMAIFRNTM